MRSVHIDTARAIRTHTHVIYVCIHNNAYRHCMRVEDKQVHVRSAVRTFREEEGFRRGVAHILKRAGDSCCAVKS